MKVAIERNSDGDLVVCYRFPPLVLLTVAQQKELWQAINFALGYMETRKSLPSYVIDVEEKLKLKKQGGE